MANKKASADTVRTGIEEITTQGDLLYRGATDLKHLPKGSSGQQLSMGNSNEPEWITVADELPTAGTSGNLLTSTGSAWASTAPAGGATKEFYIPFIHHSADTSSPAYRGSNATNFEQTSTLGAGNFVVANFYVPNDFTSVTNFVLMAQEGGANAYDFDISTSIAAVGDTYHSVTDSVTVTGTFVTYIITEIDISASLTGIAAGDYIGAKIANGHASAHNVIGLRFKYS
jgi:hypothetical protein